MSIETTISQTPMMKQYEAAKKKVSSEHLLLFRLGDFFEFFHDDAIKASQILGITLTHRNGIPMCGVPAQSVDRYIRVLLEQRQKIALCDQVSAAEKGLLVERKIVEILTPGAITNSQYLASDKEYNYLFALYDNEDTFYASWIDVSIGVLYVYTTSQSHETLNSLIAQVAPRELVVRESAISHPWCKAVATHNSNMCITARPLWSFSAEEGIRLLKRCSNSEQIFHRGEHFIGENKHLLCAIGGLLEYVQSTIPTSLFQIHEVVHYSRKKYLEIDSNAIYHLELFSTMRENDTRHSLCAMLDVCKTSMGSRMLKDFIRMPLRIKYEIEYRCDVVEYFLHHEKILEQIRMCLKAIYDIERLFTRVYLKKAHPKDVYRVGESLACAHEVYTMLMKQADSATTLFSHIFTHVNIKAIEDIITLVRSALYEDPPTQFGDTFVIKEKYDAQLDELRNIKENEDAILHAYMKKLSESSGMVLKLKSNSTFGYCFEFSHALRGKIPSVFLLRQTLKNVDRYKTDELLAIESKILHAQESLLAHEIAVFQRMTKTIASYAESIHAMSHAIAQIDILSSFAQVAREYNYTRPIFVDEHVLFIEAGRHAVVERTLTQGSFITNALHLANVSDNVLFAESIHAQEKLSSHTPKKTFLMVTGPNMAGKSTFLRQNALMLIMAHIGAFVPAEKMICGIFDKIFCRVGAADNLIKGESTFLTEMNETAFILNNATAKSLVIMDEIGRGTSVHDGTAIAQAVAEFLLEKKIFTLFTTHYHDIAHLTYTHMQACTIAAVKGENDEIVFTHKITDGIADNSYGIEVAKRSGMPRSVLSRSYDILLSRVENNINNKTKKRQLNDTYNQATLDTATSTEHTCEYEEKYHAVQALLKDVSIHSITPLQAHAILAEISKYIAPLHS